ncbi:nitroreductase family deazaflavin-dependent oxidoreductase [Mycobacterium parmense]|uniref:Nitroreductase n=1 Tax=Mycobacterium parmense TaxID=185642 RepID=A0A7I7Z213_9MYCO|nr:nitroreductase family deazaflavin-dependent oxidoreductase [Mycobacterium parmense]MCV7350265.1 nitroreductase family deazaflavin-dependent oxidoreductase [Mycobacterium parmense]ORW59751.1 nitroreductase [Mycobacterium parmense]BBZ47203.1 nitroreductase [Mycobacterium parmense]
MVLNTVRVLNKRVLNPMMLHVAGQKHWYAGVIEHKGRHSGKTYDTPVVIERTGDGFLIALPYGTQVDWLRNVLAAGRATIRVHGETCQAVEPRVIDATTASQYLSSLRRLEFGGLRIKNYLLLKRSPETA